MIGQHPHRYALSIAAIAGCALLLAGGAAAARQAKGGSTAAKPDLIIGTVAGELGTTAAIPIYLQTSGNSTISSLHLELDFVSNSVKFAKAEKGVAAEGHDFAVNTAAKELPPDDKKISHTRLTIDVTNSNPQKPLPEGLLAFLNFNIPENAKPFSISLNPITITAADSSKKPVEIAAEAGKVIVSVPDAPLAGCFFFTH